MSKLIILPGEEPIRDIDFPQTPEALVGRTLTVNPQKIRVFQTFKFYLGPRHPFGKVPPDADLSDIYNALVDGRLMDATHMQKTGLNIDGNQMSPVNVEDDPDAPRVFIGSERTTEPTLGPRQLFVAIPRTKEEEAAYLEELKNKGRIDGTYNPIGDVMMSGISVSDITPDEPIKSAEGFWELIVKAFRQLFRKWFKRK